VRRLYDGLHKVQELSSIERYIYQLCLSGDRANWLLRGGNELSSLRTKMYDTLSSVLPCKAAVVQNSISRMNAELVADTVMTILICHLGTSNQLTP